MIQNVTITGVQRYTTNKEGQPLVFKTGKNAGKAYTSVRIKTKEYGDKLISGFGEEWNKDWKAGDEVKLDIETKGEYLNFSRVNETKMLFEKVIAMEKYLKETVKPILDKNFTSDGKPVPTFNQVSPVKVNTPVTQGVPTQNILDDEIDPEEIPF